MCVDKVLALVLAGSTPPASESKETHVPSGLLSLALVTAVSGFIVAVFASACGGDGELTLDQYFEQVGAAKASMETSFTSLNAQYPAAFRDPQQTRSYLDAWDPVLKDGIQKFSAIHAPADVQDAHEEFWKAFQAILEIYTKFRGDVEGLDDPAAVQQLQNSSFDRSAFERPLRACFALQAIADENSISVQLNCQ